MTTVILIVVAILISYAIANYLSKLIEFVRTYKLARKIPGPPGRFLLGNSLDIPEGSEGGVVLTRMVHEAAMKGDSIFGLWFGHEFMVYPITGKAVKAILDSQTEITKSSDYDIFKPWLGDALLLSTGEHWKKQRRMLTPTFHFTMLDGYVQSMDKHAKRLTEYLAKKAGTNQSVDVFPIIKRTALDIICETAMGTELNSLVNENHPYCQAVVDMGTLSTKYTFTPWMWIPWCFKLSGYETKYNHILKTLTRFTEDIIKQRRRVKDDEVEEETTKKKAFLDMLLDMDEAKTFTDQELREEVDTFMFAGHDTTSTAVGWTIWSLATHPEIQEQVANEIISHLGDIEEITLNDIKELHYLDRVIKETMRVNSPIPQVGRLLQNDFVIDNFTIPRGSNLNIAPLLIHRNPKIYADPMKFNPDRFLPENLKDRHAFDYIPFSAGPRNCIGQKFAQYEARIILAWLIREFKFTTSMKFEDNLGCPEIIFRPQHGIPVNLEKRRKC